MFKNEIKMSSIVHCSPDQVSCDLAGEAVILNVKAGVYYGLNSLGNRVWELMEEPVSVREIRDAILNQYDVDQALCEKDLLDLLQDLAGEGLIEIKDRN